MIFCHLITKIKISIFKNSEYDHEIPQSQTADKPMARFVLASNKNRFSLDVSHIENLILLYVNNKGADSLGIHPHSLINALFAYWSVLLNI